MAHILIAEDDEAMLNFLVLVLERAGHTVTATNNGKTALEALNTEKHYDLLLTDIVMPGLDGVELAQKANEKRPEIKIMFITGFAGMAMKHMPKNSDEEAKLLSKPFHLNDLVEKVDALLAG
ncbi:MAG: response regulator [Alphaproteobacteria bacterium]|nr:response regulator [Alphaproteobacteria bacterium]